MENEYSIHDKIKCRFKTRNSCYYSFQTLFTCRIACKNFKIKI